MSKVDASKRFSCDEIKRFRPEEMAQASVILVLGKRFSGKSVLIKDLMYRFREKVDKGIIFSGTNDATAFYSSVFPDIYVHKKYDPERLERIILKQIKKTKEQLKRTNSKDATPESTLFCLMDDVLADSGWKNDESMKDIFFNGRHYHFMFVLASQYPMAVPSDFRNNCDYTFIYSDKDIKNRKRLHENYCGMIPFESFNILMDEVCQNFRCLVIDNRKRDLADWRDVVSWYKADQREEFRFGSEAFWSYHEKYMMDSEDEQDNSRYWKGVVNKYGNEKVVQKIRMID